MIAVRLSDSLEKRLNDLCKATHRSKSFYMRQALEDFLNDEEERYMALSSYESYLKSGKRTVSVDDVLKEAGLPSLHED